MVTWFHRDIDSDGEGGWGVVPLSRGEERPLAKIKMAYYLPRWCSVDDYVSLMEERGAENVKKDDWSYTIAPFWRADIRSSLNLKSLTWLARSGFSTIRGAYAMLLMLKGFDTCLIKFGCITCTKLMEIGEEEEGEMEEAKLNGEAEEV